MKKGIGKTLFDAGASVVGRAAGAVLSGGRGQEAVARAVGLAQRGFRRFESAQERALHLAGLAARPDYDDLHKQMARLKRKTRELSKRIDASKGPTEDAPASSAVASGTAPNTGRGGATGETGSR